MKEHKIEDIIEDRLKSVHKLSHAIIKNFDADDINDFHIEIKKMRAFLRLLNAEKKWTVHSFPNRLKLFIVTLALSGIFNYTGITFLNI